MSVAVITAPATGLVSLQDAKAHLRVEDGDSDTYITALIAAASGMIDGPFGYLGRAVVTQTLELTRDAFYCEVPDSWARIPLPCKPIQSITSVKYTDTAGDEQTLSSSVYRLSEDSITLVTGQSWPTPANESGAVRIRYVAGFGDINSVPQTIKLASLLLIAHWFQSREAIVIPQGNDPKELPLAYSALLSPYRILTV